MIILTLHCQEKLLVGLDTAVKRSGVVQFFLLRECLYKCIFVRVFPSILLRWERISALNVYNTSLIYGEIALKSIWGSNLKQRTVLINFWNTSRTYDVV